MIVIVIPILGLFVAPALPAAILFALLAVAWVFARPDPDDPYTNRPSMQPDTSAFLMFVAITVLTGTILYHMGLFREMFVAQ